MADTSKEAVLALIEKMKGDEAFRKQLMAAKGVAERLEILKKAGFDLEETHIKALHGELSDAELEQAAGGICWTDWCNLLLCRCKVRHGSICDR